ncbi:hypothetical protein JNJ66_01475 [Candidatus Saccharibacteria bacterium]|nr:hypothetical protein [Candidatus Saccharibacteria bacterium]
MSALQERVEHRKDVLTRPPLQPVTTENSPEIVLECGRLVAERYLRKGFIGPDDIDDDGRISRDADPDRDNSHYFFHVDEATGEIVATTRQIYIPEGAEPAEWQFPLERDFDLMPDAQSLIEAIKVAEPRAVVEISGLAKKNGQNFAAVLSLYRESWQFSRYAGHKVCVMRSERGLTENLQAMFGEGIIRAGERKRYEGGVSDPMLLFPDRCAGAMADNYRRLVEEKGEEAAEGYLDLVRFFLEDMDTSFLSDEEVAELTDIGALR